MSEPNEAGAVVEKDTEKPPTDAAAGAAIVAAAAVAAAAAAAAASDEQVQEEETKDDNNDVNDNHNATNAVDKEASSSSLVSLLEACDRLKAHILKCPDNIATDHPALHTAVLEVVEEERERLQAEVNAAEENEEEQRQQGKNEGGTTGKRQGDAAANTSNTAKSPSIKRNWQANFEKLQAYKARHGDTRVTASRGGDEALVEWCKTQRRGYRENTIFPARKRQLLELGFCFQPEKIAVAKKKQKKDQGNGKAATTAPQEGEGESAVATTLTTPTKPKAPAKFEIDWNTNFEKLQAYKEEFGHCRVPYNYTRDMKLAEWCKSQRRLYRESRIQLERRVKLELLGFEFAPKRGPPAKAAVAPAVAVGEGGAETGAGTTTQQKPKKRNKHNPYLEEQWNASFTKLLAYKQEFGDARVPWSFEQDERLAEWCKTQRRLYREGRMLPDRRQKLDDVGFYWKIGRKHTSPNSTTATTALAAAAAVPPGGGGAAVLAPDTTGQTMMVDPMKGVDDGVIDSLGQGSTTSSKKDNDVATITTPGEGAPLPGASDPPPRINDKAMLDGVGVAEPNKVDMAASSSLEPSGNNGGIVSASI